MLSEADLNGVVEGNRKLYEEIIQDRLSCKIYNCYNETEVDGVPNSTPQCVTDWKNHGLIIGNSASCFNECFVRG